MTQAYWPARMQRLKSGPLVEAAPHAELWLDGGHNPAAGSALSLHLASLPKRPTYLICGMLNTKDVAGFLSPFKGTVDGVVAVSIPGEANTLDAYTTAEIAADVGLPSSVSEDVRAALRHVTGKTPYARVLICGSLYLAGSVLRENG